MLAGEEQPDPPGAERTPDVRRRSRWHSVFPRPERRTRTDMIVAAAIAVAVLLAGTIIWARSDARGAESVVATSELPAPDPAVDVPASVREVWRARDVANTHPVIAAGAVVTGDGGTVTGRNPENGAQLWRYARNLPLCGVEGAFQTAVAVYRAERGCGQVTQLAGSTGRRLTARTSDADDRITLSTNFTPAQDAGYGFVLSLGQSRLELWRSDLVRTLEYGYVDAPVNPRAQPHPGCQPSSAAFNRTQLAVLERCPKESGDRLTVLKTDPKENQEPEELGSAVVGELTPKVTGGKVLSVSGEKVALYLPPHNGNPARIGIYDSKVSSLAEYSLSAPLTSAARVAKDGDDTYIWTGSSLIRLLGTDMELSWTIPDAVGAPAEMAGVLLVPVTGGISVVNPDNGLESARIPVQRNGFTGPVELAVMGATILEKRGDELVALHS